MTVTDHYVSELANQRIKLFIGTRLGVATLLLGGTLLLTLDSRGGTESFTPRFLMLLIAAMYSGSIVFSLWLLRQKQRSYAAMAQVAFDLLLSSNLVYITGGAGSAFTFLYGVAVLMAAMVIGPFAAKLTGGAAVILFVGLTVGLSSQLIPAPPDQPPDAYHMPLAELIYAALLNVMGLLLVTLLAAGLAERLISAGGQLKRAEASAAELARLNTDIINSLTSGLLTSDLAGHMQTINPAGADMLHADPASLLGQPVTRYLPVDISQVQLQAANTNTRTEGQATRPDGSQFPVGFSLNALTDAQGQLRGGLVAFQDLSEIVRLREAATRGERLAVLGRLSAGLAHEIRNPLSSISGSVELVRSSKLLEEEDRHLLGIVLREVERLDDLVSTMLLVGKPREPLRRQNDLRQLVEEVVAMAQRGPACDSGVYIATELPEVPVLAWVDGDQIRQVLWNLVKNALQASPRATTVCLRARNGQDVAIFEVIDEGRGIDEHQRERIYDMFHSERTHGAGIGLALVRQIIDAHGGSIEIISEQRRGATFVVTVPVREPGQRQENLSAQPPAA
ncbi:MAG TPA: ATP-binding protein [Polyangiales bacterium]|nr:ATP-binding protein [Polyangiales bacterium]